MVCRTSFATQDLGITIPNCASQAPPSLRYKANLIMYANDWALRVTGFALLCTVGHWRAHERVGHLQLPLLILASE